MDLAAVEVCSQGIELTTAEIAALCAWSIRTAKRMVATWYRHQDDVTLPRVRRAHRPGDTRWCYLIDRVSFERFLFCRD